MPELIDLPTARRLLAAAVETQGRDFIYNIDPGGWCYYTPQPAQFDRDPRALTGCIVGTALALHGHDTTALVGSPRWLYLQGELDMSREAAEYFQLAQSLQDRGFTWGEAYDKAEAYVSTGDGLAPAEDDR